MKRFLALISVVLILVVSIPTVKATADTGTDKPLLSDNASLLSDAEANKLLMLLEKTSESSNCDIVIITEPTLDGKDVVKAAEDIYNDKGYGRGEKKQAVVLLMDMAGGEWSVTSYSTSLFTDKTVDIMMDNIEDYLTNGKYYDGFEKYVSLCAAAFATENTIPDQRQKPLFVDDAYLVSDTNEQKLIEKLEKISKERQCEVAIVTVDGLDGKDITAAADDYFDYNGYGYGYDDSGILLMIDMDEREWATSTYGFAITAFTDYQQDIIMDKVAVYLSDDNYYKAFTTFADLCDKTLESARNGNIIDSPDDDFYDNDYDYDNNDNESVFEVISGPIFFGLIVGVVAALIGTGNMKKKLKSVRRQPSAKDYLRKGSLNLTASSDVFLYRNVSKIKRETSSGGGTRSRSGGGSRTHSSSSGRSHGGRRGKF